MPEFNSDQYALHLQNKLANLPQAGGDGQVLRFRFKAPAGGVAADDLINFGFIKPGFRFNPAFAKIHWNGGTATATIALGHTGLSAEDDDGVINDVAADEDEFLVAASIATANLAGDSLLNARVGGTKVADRSSTGVKLPQGMFLQGIIQTAGMPEGQEVVVEIPAMQA